MKKTTRYVRCLGAGISFLVFAACGSGPDEAGSRVLATRATEQKLASAASVPLPVSSLEMDAASKGAGETGALRAEERTSRLQPRAIESWEDCVRLDLATIQVKYVGGEWKIVDGPSGSHWAFGFGAEKAEAEKALKIIKSYRLSHSCFVTRPGPKMAYQLTALGDAAVTRTHRVPGEDCISFDPNKVEAKWFPAPLQTWKIVQGNMWMLDFGLDQAAVYKALRVIQSKGFNQQCFVGRPGPSFTYWKLLR